MAYKIGIITYDGLATAADVLSAATAEAPVKEMLQNKTWPGIIIQPLISGIQQGEYSLIYIAGEFSHAVHKRVAAHDFKNRLETERVGIHRDVLPPDMPAFGDQIMTLVQSRFPAYPIPRHRPLCRYRHQTGSPFAEGGD